MKDKNLFYLILSLGITSGAILTNSFIVSIPEWLAIVVMLISAVSLIVFIIKSQYKKMSIMCSRNNTLK